MTISELALLDTNILVYAADQASPFYEPSKRLRDQGANGDILIAVSPQILLEFFAVITSPKRVQNPRTAVRVFSLTATRRATRSTVT